MFVIVDLGYNYMYHIFFFHIQIWHYILKYIFNINMYLHFSQICQLCFCLELSSLFAILKL